MPDTTNNENKPQDEVLEDSYLDFKTEKEFNEYLYEHDNKFFDQIENLKKENTNLKKKDIEIKSLNDKLSIFQKSILKKYDVENLDLHSNELNYNSFDDLEKSIVKVLEQKKINYKKSVSENDSPNTKQPKIYI